MTHREVLVADVVSLGILPLSELVLVLLYCLLVDVGLADIVEQRGYYHALTLHLASRGSVKVFQAFVDHQARLARVEAVLAQAAFNVEVMTCRCRRFKKSAFLKILDNIVDALALR